MKRGLIGSILLVCLLTALNLPQPATAAGRPECLVSNERTGVGARSLQTGIDAAAAGDTLVVKGTCTGVSTIDKNLTLYGVSNKPFGVAALRGQEPGSVLTINKSVTVAISNLTIAEGEALNGGGIFNQGILSLNETTVTNNAARAMGLLASRGGGGILNDDFATLTLTNSTVASNAATGFFSRGGGGIFNSTFATLMLMNSSVLDNTAIMSGGGILNYGDLKLISSIVSGNDGASFMGGGGGIYNDVMSSATLVLTNSVVSSNTAINPAYRGSGGGIFNSQGAVTLTSSTVSGNSATDGGGGILHNSGPLTLTDSTVRNNSARSGGGIHNYDDPSHKGDSLTLTRSTVRDNTAENGGGVFNVGGTVDLNGSTISRNVAAAYGGGIWNENMGTLTLTGDSTVTENTAAQLGGGIYNLPGGTLINCIPGVNVTDNRPDNIAPTPTSGGGGGPPAPPNPGG